MATHNTKLPAMYTRFSRPKFTGLDCTEFDEETGEALPTLTQQQFANDCDINQIMARYEKTGQLPDLIRQDAKWGDFSDVPSYQEAMDRVVFADMQFNALPAKVRERFHNDPAKFLAFAGDEENQAEMRAMGLMNPLPSPADPAPVPGKPEATPPKADGKEQK